MRNLLIFTVTILILALNVFVFMKTRKKKGWGFLAIKVCNVLLFLALAIVVLIPNANWLRNPFTPSLQCKVIDATTKMPIAGADVEIKWRARCISIGGGGGWTQKKTIVTSSPNGEFFVPSIIRPLVVNQILLLCGHRLEVWITVQRQHYYKVQSVLVATNDGARDKEIEKRACREEIVTIDNIAVIALKPDHSQR